MGRGWGGGILGYENIGHRGERKIEKRIYRVYTINRGERR